MARTILETLSDRIQLIPTDQLVRARSALWTDAIRLAEVLVAKDGVVINERVRLREGLIGNERGHVTLREAFRLAEQLFQAHHLGLVDALGIGSTQQVAVAWQLIERLGLSDTLWINGSYRASLVDTMRLATSLANFYSLMAEDGFSVSDAAFSQALSIAGITETIAIEPTMQPLLLLNAVVSEGIQLDDDQLLRMIFSPTVVEGVAVKAGYLGPDGSFTTWAMNTRTGAVTEYADYAFNSFAKIGRRYLGASENGLYELLGDDDDGASIIARIRGGFLQFGGTQLSRLKEAYLAATGEQEWVLRIVSGDGDQYNYKVANRHRRSTKFHMGKGQRARYFSFELISAGADFDLDTLEFVPLVVQRRV